MNIITIPPKRLFESITATSGFLKLPDILGFDGLALTSALVGDTWYATIQNESGNVLEVIQLDPTTISAWNTTGITILKRGLDFYGTFTEISVNKKPWLKNVSIVNLGTNSPQMLALFTKTIDAQTIDGVKTFSSFPQKSGTLTPVNNAELVTKSYADSLSFSGAPDASYTQKGILERATTAEIDAGSAIGTTTAPLTINPADLNSSQYRTQLPTANEKAALAGTVGTPSASNKLVTDQDATARLNSLLFGDGSDGDVIISSNTSLTKDMYYNNLTINTGFNLNANGYKIFVKNTTLIQGTGKITRNGNNGNNGVANAGQQANNNGLSAGSLSGTPNGGLGGYSATDNATSGPNVTNAIGTITSAGSGGTGAFPGKNGSSMTVASPLPDTPKFPGTLNTINSSNLSGIFNSSGSGGGGGSSGSNGGSASGGGGGSSGGIILLCSKIINLAANNSLTSLGGNGGNGGTTGFTGSSGGGGGNGGTIILIYNSFIGTALTSASACTAGSGGTFGTLGSGNGSSGQNGNIYQFAI